MGSALFSLQTGIISMNSVNKLTFVMVKDCVLFEVSEVKLSRYRHAGD
jgi:hypothetical protein